MIGKTVGHYQVTEKIGEGGMGEVYRATDPRLNRDVALKVVPEAFAGDAQRMARFTREAQLLASLSHPNIGAIHGLEEGEGVRALVLELIEGETLEERNLRGSVPLEEALPIALQIAEALETAHEKGIIHRDLKPANIKLTPEGQIKVLDFGLAKALAGEPDLPADLSHSPTLTVAATQAGVIIGTAAYMSPEQAKGLLADRRADIWAFGVVLHEMLTGRQLYAGETVSETLARVIERQPDLDLLPAATPTRIRELLRRCLTKDPQRRLQSIGEARIAVQEALAHPEETAPRSAATAPGSSVLGRVVPWSLATVCLLALGVLWFLQPAPPLPGSPVRLHAELGADISLFTELGSAAALSPDGRLLAFVAGSASGGGRKLYVRQLRQLAATPLSGTDDARNPFFSPDGQWIAFFADNKLKKVAATGGAAITLAETQEDRGGSWGDDGTIVFSPGTRGALLRVSSAGGSPEPLTALDEEAGETTHRWPQILPGSEAILFTVHHGGGSFDDANVVIQSLGTGDRKVVQRGGFHARYLSSGHLVYHHESTLFAGLFDLKRLEMMSQPAPVLEGVASNRNNGGAQFTFSATGTVAYLPGEGASTENTLYWLKHEGPLKPLREAAAAYSSPRFSPDGRRLALDVSESGQADVWVYEWERDTMSRLTFDPAEESDPVWTPNGRRITFGSARGGKATFNLFWKQADGTGEVQRLTQSENHQYPLSWHPEGRWLAFIEQHEDQSWDIRVLPMEGDEASGWKAGEPTTFLSTPFEELDPMFSPDGRWIAYMSNESGSVEVYVRPFPGPGGKWQISTAGGTQPVWSRQGKELFYRAQERIMVTSYTVEQGSFRADKPRVWSQQTLPGLGFNRPYDIHPAGDRFAVINPTERGESAERDQIVLVSNFFEELRQRLEPVR